MPRGANEMDSIGKDNSAPGLSTAVQDLLACDAAVFVRQSGSTPCVPALRHLERVWPG
jgi:hypothetical protein